MSPLSVVVATRNRPGPLERLLDDLQEQRRTADELWVVDQSDTELRAQNAALAERGGATYWALAPEGLPAARNRALGRVGTPLVVFFDDDVRLLPGCLDAHRAAYLDPLVGGVGGRIEEVRLWPNAQPGVNRWGLGGRTKVNLEGTVPATLDWLKGANMSFRVRALRAAGGFDPGLRGSAHLEDADASVRVRDLGFALRFCPEAAVVHLASPAGGVRADRRASERARAANAARYLERHAPPLKRILEQAASWFVAGRRSLRAGDLGGPLAWAQAWNQGRKVE